MTQNLYLFECVYQRNNELHANYLNSNNGTVLFNLFGDKASETSIHKQGTQIGLK